MLHVIFWNLSHLIPFSPCIVSGLQELCFLNYPLCMYFLRLFLEIISESICCFVTSRVKTDKIRLNYGFKTIMLHVQKAVSFSVLVTKEQEKIANHTQTGQNVFLFKLWSNFKVLAIILISNKNIVLTKVIALKTALNRYYMCASSVGYVYHGLALWHTCLAACECTLQFSRLQVRVLGQTQTVHCKHPPQFKD